MGVDFYCARLPLPCDVQVALQLWDVGSGVSSLQMAANYIHGSDAVLMVHDLTQRQVRAACAGLRDRLPQGTAAPNEREPGPCRPTSWPAAQPSTVCLSCTRRR